jgi:CRISPR-associated endonuclease Cas2
MKREDKEILKLTAKEIFKKLFDFPMRFMIAFDNPKKHMISIEQYYNERTEDQLDFRNKIHYLKQQGLINTFIENKERFIELTPKGIKRLNKDSFNELKIKKPSAWDGRFRMVIFDIPEKHRTVRDGIRHKLDTIGFKQVQKSVFVYPFECKTEIDMICDHFLAKKYLKYLIADIIEGEEEIISHFLNTKTLTESDLPKNNNSK